MSKSYNKKREEEKALKDCIEKARKTYGECYIIKDPYDIYKEQNDHNLYKAIPYGFDKDKITYGIRPVLYLYKDDKGIERQKELNEWEEKYHKYFNEPKSQIYVAELDLDDTLGDLISENAEDVIKEELWRKYDNVEYIDYSYDYRKEPLSDYVQLMINIKDEMEIVHKGTKEQYPDAYVGIDKYINMNTGEIITGDELLQRTGYIAINYSCNVYNDEDVEMPGCYPDNADDIHYISDWLEYEIPSLETIGLEGMDKDKYIKFYGNPSTLEDYVANIEKSNETIEYDD